MDWLTAFSILLLVLSIHGESRSGGRKKIRIHIPQKVTHIHHHKKIYITKHMAQPTQFLPQYANPEQYASGYLATSETASIAPTIAFLPIAEGRRSTVGSPAPNLQPLYRARGHYGPPQTENEASSSNKRIKVIKISEGKKKRIIRMKKPKRIVIKTSSPHKHQDEKDSNTMSAFHDEFYSDVKQQNPSTFKRTRKPKRVEKYMEGDTEHIHTYSEEHIHQIVYDKPTPNAQHSEVSPALLPIEGMHHHPHHAPPQYIHSAVPTSVIPSAIPTTLTIQGATASHLHAAPNAFSLGSLGTPSHMEYMNYEPHEVTHDHIIHDHGEMIHQFPEMKIPTSPKASYNSQGIKLNPSYSQHEQPSYEGKGSWVSQDSAGKGSDNTNDFSYYENFYKPSNGKIPSFSSPSNIGSVHKKPPNADITPLHKFQEETQLNQEFQFEELFSDPLKSTVSTFHGNDYKKRPKHKPHTSNHGPSKKPKFPKSLRQHHHHKVAENKPYTTSSSFMENHSFTGFRNGFKDVKEPPTLDSFKHFTNIYGSTSPFEAADAFGSSSNDHKKEKQPPPIPHSWRNKKNKSNKSVSSQNINFGGQEHKMVINHETSVAIGGSETRSIGGLHHSPSPQPSTIDITYSPMESYYNNPSSYDGPSSMPDASNTNFRIVEAPKSLRQAAKTTQSPIHEEMSIIPEMMVTYVPTTEASVTAANKVLKKNKKKSSEKRQRVKQVAESRNIETTRMPVGSDSSGRGKFKYGDRLNERYDYEYDDLLFI